MDDLLLARLEAAWGQWERLKHEPLADSGEQGTEFATLFIVWAAQEGVLEGISEEEAVRLGKAFLAGLLIGRGLRE